MIYPSIEKRDTKRLVLFSFLSFTAAFLSLIAVFGSAGLWLFGPKSILISDMKSQYIHFFMALRNGDILYSNGMGLSGSFAGTFAYYLSSPFSLLIFLFKKENLQSALLLIIILKLSLSAFSFSFLQYSITKKADLSLAVFPLCYSLMSFGMYFFINLFWLDALVYLPFLVMGVIKLIEEKAARSLPFLLFVLFVSNFYISYITGIFLVLFLITESVIRKRNVKEILASLLKLFIYAVVALLMAAPVLLPAMKDLIQSFGVEAFNGYGILNFTLKQFLLKLFLGYYDSIGNFAAPTVFCGTLIFILCSLFFTLKNVCLREKLSYAFFILLFLASFLFPSLDRIWHVFSFPNAFAYRYAFCFSFLLIYIALKTYMNISSVSHRYLVLWFLPPLLCLIFIKRLLSNLSSETIILTVSALLLYSLLLILTKKVKTSALKHILTTIVFLLSLSELTANGMLILRSMQNQINETGYVFPSYSEWVEDRVTTLTLLEYADDLTLHRVADTSFERANEGVALGYNGVSSFSSSYSPEIQGLFLALGYDGTFKGYLYIPGSIETDSLLGIRWLLSESSKIAGYKIIAKIKDRYLLENASPSLNSIVFPVSNEMKEISLTDSPQKNLEMINNVIYPYSCREQSSGSVYLRVAEWKRRNTKVVSDSPYNFVLQTTFPYDSNYEVRIDGKRTKTFKTLNSLLAVDVSAGKHEVKISYIPKLFYAGLAISIIAITSWLVICNRYRKEQKRTEKYSLILSFYRS